MLVCQNSLPLVGCSGWLLDGRLRNVQSNLAKPPSAVAIFEFGLLDGTPRADLLRKCRMRLDPTDLLQVPLHMKTKKLKSLAAIERA